MFIGSFESLWLTANLNTKFGFPRELYETNRKAFSVLICDVMVYKIMEKTADLTVFDILYQVTHKRSLLKKLTALI